MADFSDLREKGFDVEAALSYTGDEKKYKLALTRYHNAYEKNRGKLERYLAEDELANYEMLVHSLKSNSRMIGNMELGDICEKLQYAAADKDMTTIEANHDNMLAEYKKTMEIIAPYAEENGANKPSSDEAKKLIGELKETLDDMELNKSLKLYKRLSEYDFTPSAKNIYHDIKDEIDAFNYDEACDLCDELLEALG